MTINDLVINVSNLIWTDEVKKAWVKRSTFVVQDMGHPNAAGVIGNDRYKYFNIYCGSERIEYGLTDYPAYLAVITEDGRYRLERLEPYMKEHDSEIVFDVRDLPDQINGLDFQKAEDFCNTPWHRGFNRPCGHVAFHTEEDSSNLWTIEGWSTVTFVIGISSAGKSHFIEKNFRDCGYTVLDVFNYQQRTRKDPNMKWLSSRGRAYQANKWLKEDIVELIRQGKDVVVEQTFYRALCRIDCVDAIHKVSRHIQIDVYVIMPSEERLWQNCVKRWGSQDGVPKQEFERSKHDRVNVFEFPDRAEGFSRIFAVSDDGITQRMDGPADWALREEARAELQKDAEWFDSELEAARQRKRWVEKILSIHSRQEDSSADAAGCDQ